jgi:hypothetical protein
MITSSGAEGINLRNTRFVHIVEPYWQMVRVEQVIGRARRICSHQDLPEELRNVKVFIYVTKFTQEQMTNKKNIELMIHDVSRTTNKPVTTDQSLLEIAQRKTTINNQLLNAMKETAIDCALYNPDNKEENLVCYGFGKVTSNAFASYPTLEQDLAEPKEGVRRAVKLVLKKTKPINGIVYVYDPKTMDLYDEESYEQEKAGLGQLVRIGKIIKQGKGFIIQKF